MSKKVIKYIVELFYIFIIPLLLICVTCTLSSDREYVYDNDGNFLTSEETKSISFDNSIIKYTKGYKNIINNFNIWNEEWLNGYYDSITGEYTITNSNICNKNPIEINSNTQYYIYLGENYTLGIKILYYDNNYDLISIDSNIKNTIITTPNNSKYINFNTYTGDNYNNYTKPININLSITWANGNYVPYNEPLIIYSDTDISGQNNINYTIWGNIKESFEIALDLNSNSLVLDIIFCYIVLWFIMFLTWHIIYLLFDKLFHLRRE